MLTQLFNRRSLLGTILFMLLSGELTVWQKNGLFTPLGFIILFFMYFTFFHLVESFIVSRHAVIYQIILFSFACFGIIAFGIFHMELADFVTNPSLDLITFLMRLQPAVFPIFALYLLNQIYPRDDKRVLSMKNSLLLFILYALLLTPTQAYGFYLAIQTFQIASLISVVALIIAITALWLSSRKTPAGFVLKSKTFSLLVSGFFIISLIPIVSAYIVLIILMPLSALILLLNKHFRQGKI